VSAYSFVLYIEMYVLYIEIQLSNMFKQLTVRAAVELCSHNLNPPLYFNKSGK